MNGPVLGAVGLDPASDDTLDGLVSVHYPPATLRIDEDLLVRSAQDFEAVDYIFFRRFDDGRSSHQPPS